MADKKSNNLKDVAALAQVSLGTASKVVNDIYVRPALRIRVEQAMKDLHYVPNSIARSLKINTTRTIGIIIPDISRTVTSKIVQGVDEVGQKSGYSTMICNTQIREENELSAIKNFKEKMVDGIIYTGNTVSDKVARAMKQTGMPIVFVSTGYEDKYFSSVRIDNEKAAYEAVGLLLSRGHKRIAMLAGERVDMNAGEPRLMGYRKALADSGVSFDDRLVEFGHYRVEDGYQNMKILLEKPEHFTAVFCASDDMAFGALKAVSEKNLRVPEDISILGFDGIDFINYITPKIGTVYQPLFEFGAEAARILISQIEEKRTSTNLILNYEIKENESVLKLLT